MGADWQLCDDCKWYGEYLEKMELNWEPKKNR